MKLYHGTFEPHAKSILSDGKIKSNIERIYDSKSKYPTTDGYVYLTDSLSKAMFYGIRVIPLDVPDQIYVFEIEIDESELEVDYDEIKVMSVWQSVKKEIESLSKITVSDCLRITNCTVVNRDLVVGKDVVRYAIFPTSDTMFFNNVNDEEIIKYERLVNSVYSIREDENEIMKEFLSHPLTKWIEL